MTPGLPDSRSNQDDPLEHAWESCEAEKAFEVERDRQFARLHSLVRPFPAAAEFPVSPETPAECTRVLSGLSGTHPRVIFAIESYKHIDMVKRVVRRLAFGSSHGFLLHLASDVGSEHTNASHEFAHTLSHVCVIRSGYMVYRTSTDMRILFSMWRWLLEAPVSGWDFFISLSGADYPAVDGATLSRLLRRAGNVSWRLPERGVPAGSTNRSTARPMLGMRFTEYGLGCQYTRNYTRQAGRQRWLFALVPEMAARWTLPYSSGGIFHRDTIDFLVNDDRARAAFMYFRLFPTSGVEHYWATVYTLPDMAPLLSQDTVVSCHMQWRDEGGGRLEHAGKGGTAHNTFLDISQWDAIEREMRRCTPFLRKFDPVKERNVLDRIDASSTLCTAA